MEIHTITSPPFCTRGRAIITMMSKSVRNDIRRRAAGALRAINGGGRGFRPRACNLLVWCAVMMFRLLAQARRSAGVSVEYARRRLWSSPVPAAGTPEK